MTLVVRAIRRDDLDALCRMAASTGGGFTNLPPDRDTLAAKIERACASFARSGDEGADDVFAFALEDSETGAVRGTCQIFARIGATWPFYSYRIGTMTQVSKQLGKTLRAETLTLCTDLDGATEIGGLFLDADARSGGAGKLLARSRYLFIHRHRERFADRTLAELRGIVDEAGTSPFWDGLAGRFFEMPFREADEFNAVHGNQFIADLMPKHPIYISMLPDAARAAIGKPHASGAAAMRMLKQEGFAYDCYVDIFDGGPTMIADTDGIATLRDAVGATVTGIGGGQGKAGLIAAGQGADFRCCCAHVAHGGTGLRIDAASAAALQVALGDAVVWVPA